MLQMGLGMYVPISILDHMCLRSLGSYAHATKPGRILYFNTNDEMPNLVANLQGILVGLGISGSGSL
jgi:hypothetical protein